MQTIYIIERITDKSNNDRLDGRYPLRIGRKCTPIFYGYGLPANLEYCPLDTEDYRGTLRTSRVENIEHNDGNLIVTTMNSMYYLRELEG